MMKLVDIEYDDEVSCCWSTINGISDLDIKKSTYENVKNERLFVHRGKKLDMFDGATGKVLTSFSDICATAISASGHQLLVCHNNEVSVMSITSDGNELIQSGSNTIPFEGVCEEDDGG